MQLNVFDLTRMFSVCAGGTVLCFVAFLLVGALCHAEIKPGQKCHASNWTLVCLGGLGGRDTPVKRMGSQMSTELRRVFYTHVVNLGNPLMAARVIIRGCED